MTEELITLQPLLFSIAEIPERSQIVFILAGLLHFLSRIGFFFFCGWLSPLCYAAEKPLIF